MLPARPGILGLVLADAGAFVGTDPLSRDLLS